MHVSGIIRTNGKFEKQLKVTIIKPSKIYMSKGNNFSGASHKGQG
jgi:hypothetical protein